LPSPEAKRGTLYLVPVPLGPAPLDSCLAADALGKLRELRYFIAESAKTARAWLKPVMPVPIAQVQIEEMGREPDPALAQSLLGPLHAGADGGLLAEAGVPCLADPGAVVVRAAHRLGIRVVPWIGPSAPLLALIASGLIGQRFAFHGYLPIKEPQLKQALQTLERDAATRCETQIFIEAPYRNDRLLATITATCRPDTWLAVAADLTLPSESIVARRIRDWRAQSLPRLDRRPTVFLIGVD
jgi:16S rRNA (cytidine1402-2'-O)-methyltransferase